MIPLAVSILGMLPRGIYITEVSSCEEYISSIDKDKYQTAFEKDMQHLRQEKGVNEVIWYEMNESGCKGKYALRVRTEDQESSFRIRNIYGVRFHNIPYIITHDPLFFGNGG